MGDPAFPVCVNRNKGISEYQRLFIAFRLFAGPPMTFKYVSFYSILRAGNHEHHTNCFYHLQTRQWISFTTSQRSLWHTVHVISLLMFVKTNHRSEGNTVSLMYNSIIFEKRYPEHSKSNISFICTAFPIKKETTGHTYISKMFQWNFMASGLLQDLIAIFLLL